MTELRARPDNSEGGSEENVTGSEHTMADATEKMAQDVTIVGTEFFSGSTSYPVKVTSDGELAVTSTERERNNLCHFAKNGLTATTYYVLVDLSDTTNFPHDSTGRIDFSLIKAEIEKSNANEDITIKIGLLTRVDGTDGDVSWLWGLSSDRSDAKFIEETINYAPSQLKFAVGRFITNDLSANVAAINTGAALESPRGAATVTPAVGDVILGVIIGTATADIDLEILYHSEA